MFRKLIAASLCSLIIGLSSASAHYLWITVNRSGQQQTVDLYFEEAPSMGDGKYLDPFIERGKTWVRTLDQSKPKTIKMMESKKPGKRWLSAKLSEQAPMSVESYCQWGTYRYGKIDVLLHYYSQALAVTDPQHVKDFGRAENLALDIVPHLREGSVKLEVLWKGKPAGNRPITIRGVGGNKNLTTNEAGILLYRFPKAGKYTFRTNVEVNQGGEFKGKAFQQIRHHSTLILNLPPGMTAK